MDDLDNTDWDCDLDDDMPPRKRAVFSSHYNERLMLLETPPSFN
jgi:hypothetical protein